ncbi:MAG: hypothetical protein LBT41_00420 [Candidatus Methanoplasma sp.]|jgi:hypothetical protein|nr:hypothetical protein [Candidatus Methanoplasma sp.]
MEGKSEDLHKDKYAKGVFRAILMAGETVQDRFDNIIVKVFPAFLAACVVLIVFLTAYLGNFTFVGVIYSICLGFVLGFAVLGLFCAILSNRGVVNPVYVIALIVGLPAMVSILFYRFGSLMGPNNFLVRFFDMFGGDVSLGSLMLSTYSITLMMFLVGYGVVSVIVGYFRTYFYRVLLSLKSPPAGRKNHIPEWLFQIPDIIDIERVELEPEEDNGRFNTELFINTAVSLFVLGMVICSYIFLNPVFLRAMPFEEMLFIGVLISLFISPLIIPWSIVKSIGAKVVSSAPRPFYLWKGMRGRLYQGFFAITFFMMLLTASIYFGMDLFRILTTYVGYMIFMGLISVITSFVYVNVYYTGFKEGIIRSYTSSVGDEGKDN